MCLAPGAFFVRTSLSDSSERPQGKTTYCTFIRLVIVSENQKFRYWTKEMKHGPWGSVSPHTPSAAADTDLWGLYLVLIVIYITAARGLEAAALTCMGHHTRCYKQVPFSVSPFTLEAVWTFHPEQERVHILKGEMLRSHTETGCLADERS